MRPNLLMAARLLQYPGKMEVLMKLGIIYALLFGLTLLVFSQAHASVKHECRVETGDIGTIIGRDPSSEAAFEDAATKCFERHESNFVRQKRMALDTDTGEMLIDLCANIKCE